MRLGKKPGNSGTKPNRKRPLVRDQYKARAFPPMQEWLDLQFLLSLIPLIIEDEPRQSGGLFAPPEESSGPSGVSRLGAEIDRLARLGYVPIDKAWAPRVCELLPGAHNLGRTPDERLAGFRVGLPNVPAYAWLHRQPDYLAILAMMRRRAADVPAFADPLAEYRLIEVIWHPAASFHFSMSMSAPLVFPTAPQLTALRKDAEDLQERLRGFAALAIARKVSWEPYADMASVVDALKAIEAEYSTKPRDEGREVQMSLGDEIIRGVAKAFGPAALSAPIIGQILSLIDDKTTPANLRARLRAMGLRPASDPGEATAASADASPLGPYSQLVRDA